VVAIACQKQVGFSPRKHPVFTIQQPNAVHGAIGLIITDTESKHITGKIGQVANQRPAWHLWGERARG